MGSFGFHWLFTKHAFPAIPSLRKLKLRHLHFFLKRHCEVCYIKCGCFLSFPTNQFPEALKFFLLHYSFLPDLKVGTYTLDVKVQKQRGDILKKCFWDKEILYEEVYL